MEDDASAHCKIYSVWNPVWETDAPLILGSDASLETPDPFEGLYAAVTRKLVSKNPVDQTWVSEECLDLETALQAYKVNPQVAFERGKDSGQLEPAYAADLVLIDRDPYVILNEAVSELDVLGVMTGGILRFMRI